MHRSGSQKKKKKKQWKKTNKKKIMGGVKTGKKCLKFSS